MSYEIVGTKQEVFDKVVTHLVKQRGKAVDINRCMYRAPNGFKCALGCLIPDEEYRPYFEGNTLCTLVTQGDLIVSEDLYDLIDSLQLNHDKVPLSHMFTVNDFAHIATKFGLTLPEVS